MGRIFIEDWKEIATILLCSRSLEKAKKVAQEFTGNIVPRENSDIGDADIVIVSVPTDKMLKTCQDALVNMKKGSLLMDLCSVKTGLVDKLQVPPEVEFISCHPLFGPNGTLKDANVILVPIKYDKWLDQLKKLLIDSEAIITVTDYKEHDKIMSRIQVMYHFASLCLVKALADANIDDKYHTRSYKIAEDLFKNFKKNLDVLFEIQEQNPFNKEAREFFHKTVGDLKDLQPKEFEKKVRESFSIISDN